MNSADIAKTAVERLRAQMRRHGIGACIASDPVSVTYLSGYVVGGFISLANATAFLLLTDSNAVLVTPERAEVAESDWLRQVRYPDYSAKHDLDIPAAALEALAQAVPVLDGAGKVAAELAHLPAAAYQMLSECRGVESIVDLGAILATQRAVKSAAEVEAIRRTVRASDAIFAAVQQRVRAGQSEMDVYGLCLQVAAEEADGPAVLAGDFVSGERTVEMGGNPTKRMLQRGDLLILDVYPRIGAYWADVTRTFVVGPPTQAQRDLHALAREAMAAGERVARPGTPFRDLYAAVQAVFSREAMADRFPHHAGHCVGIKPFEDPVIVPESKAVLQEGMVITLEPGLYVPAVGGVRVEENYVVTKDGPVGLSQFPRDLVELGG
ncbi:MAG: M24 family metallopeptidase [Anaerolineae bacterium]